MTATNDYENLGPVQPGRRPRPEKPARTPRAGWLGPDPLLAISSLIVLVILIVGGVFAVRSMIGNAHRACEQVTSDPVSCSRPSTGDIDPLIVPPSF